MKPPSMWKVSNYTPYAARKSWGRDNDGVHEWIVVVKGTFNIAPNGALTLADDQIEPLLEAEYSGEDGASSLRYEADLVATKPTTDILVNGTAYAPGGRPSTEFFVSLGVGSIVKTLRVVGNRRRRRGGLGSSAVEPVFEVPIVYERAYGGADLGEPDPARRRMDLRNPVGCGVLQVPDEPLPNFEYPGKSVSRAGPAGFGPLSSHWQPRIQSHGTYDAAWLDSRYPLAPADWDARSLLCAPADQRPARHLVGGEPVELLNMTRSGRLGFSLPSARFDFRTRISGRVRRHVSRLATVIIEPDHPRVLMVWHTSLEVRTEADYLEWTKILEAHG